jgi:hypothetical protein|tara:strand:+ start:460 stop:1047 length:588 start_codon:yes stop_codon:yes gene_type:complete
MTSMMEESKYIKKNQQLPAEIREAFTHMSGSNPRRDALIYALVSKSWTYEAVANASGLTRERVRQIVRAVEKVSAEIHFDLGFDVPEPPLKPQRVRATYVEPTPETLARLLELQPYAQQVRSSSPRYREEAEEYTALLNHARTVEQVTLYRLAKRLGITHGAIRFRLARYGYIEPGTAKSKVYNLVNIENRAVKS